MTAFVCQQLFWFFQIFFPAEKPSFLRWIFILPYCFLLCQQLFTFIFQSIYIMVEMAQKKKSQSLKILLLLPIGSKRRKRDLNPRAGCPTYTLSRGASSASWVFLHDLNIVSTNMLLASFRDAKIIIHKLYAFVNRFFYYFPNCRYCLWILPNSFFNLRFYNVRNLRCFQLFILFITDWR